MNFISVNNHSTDTISRGSKMHNEYESAGSAGHVLHTRLKSLVDFFILFLFAFSVVVTTLIHSQPAS